jgi:hypothetical protein
VSGVDDRHGGRRGIDPSADPADLAAPKDNVAVAVMCNMGGAAVRESLARKIGEIAAQQE